MTVRNHCLSGGAIEYFLEPALPAPRVVVVGQTPIAEALRRLCPELGLEPVAGGPGEAEPAEGDLALVVAAHGRDELQALRQGLEAGVPYVALVASARRGAGVIDELRAGGVSEDLLARIDVPAGLDIGARTAPEIALSILAKVVAVRRPRPRPNPAGSPSVADPFVTGLVLGAGGSKRLGRPKQLLPYGEGTLLGHVVGVAGDCGFDQTVVAIGGRRTRCGREWTCPAPRWW